MTGSMAWTGEVHETLGFITCGLAIAAAALRLWRYNKPASWWGYV